MTHLRLWLIAIGFTLFVVKYLGNYFKLVKLVWKLKGPPALPFFGNVLYLNKPEEMLKVSVNAPKYGRLIRFWASFIPVILVYEPDHLQIILSNSKKSKKSIFYSLLDNLIGPGLATLNGDRWKFHRKLIQPYFRSLYLQNYIEAFENEAHLLVSTLREKHDVKITTYINDFILNILLKTILGIDNGKERTDTPFRKGQCNLTYRLERPWLLLESIFKFTSTANKEGNQRLSLYTFTKKVLKERKKQMSLKSNCIMDMLLETSENNPQFTEDDIIHESCTFMLAGQDSTGTALATALFYIAENQNIQNKIIEEQNTIFTDKNASITMHDLRNMTYLDMCIKENLRLCPTVPLLARELTEDIVLDEHTIPKGSNILMSPFVTQRLSQLYPDPEKFDPDRFLPENIDKIHPYSYFPFSGGARNCIGNTFATMAMKVFLSVFLRNYEISLDQDCDKLNFRYRITLMVKGGVKLILKPRL